MAQWTGKSRGTLLGYKIVVAWLRTFDLPGTYFLVRIISYYYFLFAGAPKKAIQGFYTQTLGYSPKKAKQLCRQNFYLLAQNLLDKVALLIGKGKKVTYTQEGENNLKAWAEEGKGGFLLSAHLGNWAIAGNLLKGLNIKVNVLMVENEEAELKDFLDRQKGGAKFNVIPIKDDMSHLISIYKALKAGEFICINADRYLPEARTISVPFLGQEARFPEGPFTLIKKLKAKYSFVFAVKDSKYGYHFTSTLPTLPANSTQEIAQEYVHELEKKVKSHPEQWYNYYNFYA